MANEATAAGTNPVGLVPQVRDWGGPTRHWQGSRPLLPPCCSCRAPSDHAQRGPLGPHEMVLLPRDCPTMSYTPIPATHTPSGTTGDSPGSFSVSESAPRSDHYPLVPDVHRRAPAAQVVGPLHLPQPMFSHSHLSVYPSSVHQGRRPGT